MFLSLYSDNLIILEFRDVWDKDCCICNRRVCNCERREKRDICVKVLLQHFFLHIFLPIRENKKSGHRRENFFPCFLSHIFSFPNQTMENNIFHHIFLSLFSIFPIFTPTKHNLKSENRFYFGPCHQPSNRKCIRSKRSALLTCYMLTWLIK